MNQFEIEIKDKLTRLSDKSKLLFAFLITEKLYPHYVAFEERYHWGDSKLLFEAMTLIYQYLTESRPVSNKEIVEMISKIDLVTPDMDDFGSALSSFALNAATSVYSALNYLIDKNIDNLVDIVSYELDTIDLYVQDKEGFDTLDPSRDVQIEHDDFMVSESQRIRVLLAKLSEMDLSKITDDLIDHLRDRKAIIDLSLLSE